MPVTAWVLAWMKVNNGRQYADSHVARVVALPERDFLPISTSAKLDTQLCKACTESAPHLKSLLTVTK